MRHKKLIDIMKDNQRLLRSQRCLPVIAALLLVAGNLYAQQVTEEQALQKAQSFMLAKIANAADTRKTPAKVPALSKVKMAKQADGLYLFNAEDNGGFVIVSGDERTEDILGYSTEGCINPENIPANMKSWLECYDSLIRAIPAKVPQATSSSVQLHAAVAPMITTKWDQGKPYNLLCPEEDGSLTKTGCVATAMAQIMNYHKWPQSMTAAIPAYGYRPLGWDKDKQEYTYQYHLDELPPTLFDWDNMKDSYKDDETGAAADAVAKLMRYCGQSVKMNYGIYASSAGNSAEELIEYFGYDGKAVFTSRYPNGTNNPGYSVGEWDELIYNELQLGRPVWFGGNDPNFGGHSFICDGYDGNGFYHFNWGWGGSGDGYFRLNDTNGFTFFQDAVVGIQPPNEAKVKTPQKDIYSYLYTLRDREGHVSIYAVYESYVESYMVIDGAIGVLQADGSVIPLDSLFEKHLLELGDRIETEVQIDLSDGHYRLVALWKEISEAEWHYPEGGWYLELTIAGNTITTESKSFEWISANFNATIEPVGDFVVNRWQEIAVHCSDADREMWQPLYLFASQTEDKGRSQEGKTLYLEKGGEETVILSFFPEVVGLYHVWVAKDESGNDVVAQTDVEIVEPLNVDVDPYWKFDWSSHTMKLKFINNSNMVYDNEVAVQIWERENRDTDGRTYSSRVYVEPGNSFDVDIVCSDMDIDKLYSSKPLYSLNPKGRLSSKFNTASGVAPLVKGDFTVGSITYDIIDEINGYVFARRVAYGAPAHLTVPGKVVSPNDGCTYSVKGIETGFCSSDNVTDVIISEGITTIDFQSFVNCEKLVSLTLPSTINRIRNSMIENCPNLKKIYSRQVDAPQIVDWFGRSSNHLLSPDSQSTYDAVKLYVPENSVESYNREWPYFKHVYATDFEEGGDGMTDRYDLNNDGRTDISDVLFLMKHIAGK